MENIEEQKKAVIEELEENMELEMKKKADKLKADQLAAAKEDKDKADKLAADKAKEDQLAAVKADKDKAKEDQLAAAKADKDKADKLAADKAKEDQLAAAKASNNPDFDNNHYPIYVTEIRGGGKLTKQMLTDYSSDEGDDTTGKNYWKNSLLKMYKKMGITENNQSGGGTETCTFYSLEAKTNKLHSKKRSVTFGDDMNVEANGFEQWKPVKKGDEEVRLDGLGDIEKYITGEITNLKNPEQPFRQKLFKPEEGYRMICLTEKTAEGDQTGWLKDKDGSLTNVKRNIDAIFKIPPQSTDEDERLFKKEKKNVIDNVGKVIGTFYTDGKGMDTENEKRDHIINTIKSVFKEFEEFYKKKTGLVVDSIYEEDIMNLEIKKDNDHLSNDTTVEFGGTATPTTKAKAKDGQQRSNKNNLNFEDWFKKGAVDLNEFTFDKIWKIIDDWNNLATAPPQGKRSLDMSGGGQTSIQILDKLMSKVKFMLQEIDMVKQPKKTIIKNIKGGFKKRKNKTGKKKKRKRNRSIKV